MTGGASSDLACLRLNTPFGERVFRHRASPADRAVIQQCFVQPQYACPGAHGRAIDAGYAAMLRRRTTPFILDLGANIGASAVWFAVRYPDAHIAAFEPHPDNFQLLEQNCTGLAVETLRAAVCGAAAVRRLVDPGLGEWGYRLATLDTLGAGLTVDCVVLGDWLAHRLAGDLAPFILKIDIEGGEADLFAHADSLLQRFPVVILEPHDWLLPGSAVSRGFFRWHAASERDFVFHAENVFSIDSAWLRAALADDAERQAPGDAERCADRGSSGQVVTA
jgi:FkbM family methyltransferase